MNAQQLRYSILQEAIEGRLVPQDTNDDPASVLLERIREEKKRLLKEGKLKKKDLVETPISEDEKPFDIPESWEWVRLGEISTYAITKKKINASQADPNLWGLDLEDIEKGGRLVCLKSVGERKAIGDKTFFSEGDILYSKLRPYLLKILIAPKDGICTPEIIPFTCYGCICKEFIVYLLKSVYVDDYINSVTFGVKMPRVSTETMVSLVLPLPPLAEQKRIVAKIEELLPKVEEYGKAQDALNNLNEELPEKLKKSVLQEAIEGRLVPQDPNDEPASVLLERIREEKKRLVKEGKLKKKDLEETPISEDEKPFEIPENWKWVRMQDVIEFVNGRAYKRDELLDKGKYKVLRVGNFFTNESWYYSDLELPDEKYCYKDDLLYAWSASFGPKIWDGDKTIFHYHIWNVKYNKNILFKDYLFYFFLIDKESIKSATTGSTMVHVSMENMKPRLLSLPPLAEQKRIVAKIEEVFKEIEKL